MANASNPTRREVANYLQYLKDSSPNPRAADFAVPVVRKRPVPSHDKFRLTAQVPLEQDVLRSVLGALKFSKKVAWYKRMNSGSYIAGDSKDRRYIRYGFIGCPDILGMLKPRRDGEPGMVLAIEVKRPSGKPTPEQLAFLDLVTKNGGCAGIVRSVDDLELLLRRFE